LKARRTRRSAIRLKCYVPITIRGKPANGKNLLLFLRTDNGWNCTGRDCRCSALGRRGIETRCRARPLDRADHLIVITDRIPVQQKRRAVEKGIRLKMGDVVSANLSYLLVHHESKSNIGLQVADYVCWAIARKYNRDDDQYYRQIRPSIRSEYLESVS
jgi:hypothetical protein